MTEPNRRIRVSAACGLLWCLTACGAPAPPGGDPPVQAAPAGSPERGAFALLVRGDTTVVDEYTRTDELLEGEVHTRTPGAKFRRARYRVEFSEDGVVRRADLAFPREGDPAGAPPMARWTVTVQGETVEEQRTDRAPVRARAAPGLVPLFAPSIAMFQEVVLRAHRLTGGQGEARIATYAMAGAGRIDTVTVSWVHPDSVEVRYGGGPLRLAVDRRGGVLGGVTSDGELRTVRVR